ncbi:iron complex outermembrane receptor protein [Xanthomonas sacchari]|uniref:TonB-dependent receptor n=1 Tax=unclassified Xanthomonas TaxID=2643310 RepID=UPI001371CA4D|nr:MULTISPECIES: TonB-dependent receptor [unclassified Xanthomonas]MBB6368919.1 iron complex outermembrane receptor protein [Xanthomonas sp. F10]MXV32898.1 TonB-dependent receptor [Xanthomonas sp. LMG 8989]
MKTYTHALAVLAGLAAGDGAAQTSTDTTTTLGTVEARRHSAASLSTRNILSSVDVLGSEQIGDKNVMNSWELLGQMPGMQLTETRQGAESGKVTFRAFNGEGYLNGIKVLIDGVPSNVNSGNQRFIDMIFPLEIAYIEVVRGTNDPRYGLHNIGGNFNIATRQGGNYQDLRLSGGSFATRELQYAAGHEADGLAQNYFVGAQAAHGYRQHDTSRKYTLGGKWFYGEDDDAARIGLIARIYHHEADEPGFLTAAQLAEDRAQSPPKNANDGDDRDMRQASVHADFRLGDGLQLRNTLYFNRYEDDRRVTFTDYPIGNAPRQRRQWDETQTGLLSTVAWQASDLLSVEAGFNAEHQDNRYRRARYAYGVPTDFDRAPARVQNDDRYSLDNLGLYLQAVLQPTDALKIVPAFRADRFSGETALPGGIHAPLQRYGWIDQPKLSVIYALTPQLSVYANWGRTFQILTGSTAPAYLTPGQPAFRPSINTGKELGLKLQPVAGTEARVAVWRQDATDEVANMPSTGTTVGLGQTRRQGVDLQLSTQLGERWTAWLSHAVQEAKVVSAYTAAGESLRGREVFSTPRYISNAGLDYRPDARWTFGVQARAQGDYYIDERNARGKYGGFRVVDASVRYQLTSRSSLGLQVKNLTDARYAYVWYDNFFWGGNDQPMFSPAPGRSAYLSVEVRL